MNNPPSPEVEACRIAGPHGENYGAFTVKIGAFRLRCIISCGMGWDHVSVSLPNRCPTWEEMDHIKRLFWPDHEAVIQYHIHGSQKRNLHPFCLHLWRPQTPEEHSRYNQEMLATGDAPPDFFQYETPSPLPMPPKIMV